MASLMARALSRSRPIGFSTMIRAHGRSWPLATNLARWSCSNSESLGGFRTGASGIVLLHGMTAELIAKRREHPFGEWIVLSGSEAREQGGGDDRQRYRSFNRVLHGPAAFSRILDVRFETR